MDALAQKAIAPKWVRKYLHELSANELELAKGALGYLPWDPDSGGVEKLLARVRAGQVHLLTTPGNGEPAEAALFFELQNYPGGKNLHVNAWVALGPKVGRLAQTDIPILETLARALDCRSMSLETHRPGLIECLTRTGWRATSVVCRKALT